MARFCPQSQAQSVLDEKRALVQRLLAQGLTVKQITMQLHCSDQFVYRIRQAVQSTPPLLDALREDGCPDASSSDSVESARGM